MYCKLQALEKNVREFGMRRHIYRADIPMQKMFRMSKAIALLPPNRAAEGFEVIKHQSTLSPNREIVDRFVYYFQTQWMERKLSSFIAVTLSSLKSWKTFN